MNRKGGNVKDEEDKGGERRIGKEEPQDEGKKNAVALKKNRVKQKLDLPPGQRPVKEMSVPQSLVCLHVPCSLKPSQRVWAFGVRRRGREGQYTSACALGSHGCASLESLERVCGRGGS